MNGMRGGIKARITRGREESGAENKYVDGMRS